MGLTRSGHWSKTHVGSSGHRIPRDCRSKSSLASLVNEASLRGLQDLQNDPSWGPQIHFKAASAISAIKPEVKHRICIGLS